MKIADYIYEQGINPRVLGSRLGLKNRSTVHRYLRNERTPAPSIMVRITQVTNGRVTLDDFLDPRPPRCADVRQRPDGTTHWFFPWSRTAEEAAEATDEPEDEGVSVPVHRALTILTNRAEEIDAGRYRLDGVHTDIRGLIRAANSMLSQAGQPVIPYPGVESSRG